MTKPSCFGTFIKTGKGSKDDSGSQGRTVKKTQQPVNLREKRLEMQDNWHSDAWIWKSLTHVQHVALATRVREFTSDMYYVLTLSPWLTQ